MVEICSVLHYRCLSFLCNGVIASLSLSETCADIFLLTLPPPDVAHSFFLCVLIKHVFCRKKNAEEKEEEKIFRFFPLSFFLLNSQMIDSKLKMFFFFS